jgi:hypothetical protein
LADKPIYFNISNIIGNFAKSAQTPVTTLEYAEHKQKNNFKNSIGISAGSI